MCISWTLDGNLITLLQLQASEVLVTTIGIQCSINIYFTGGILDKPVTIQGIRNLGHRTLHLISLTIITCQNLGASRERRIQDTLKNVDTLNFIITNKL